MWYQDCKCSANYNFSSIPQISTLSPLSFSSMCFLWLILSHPFKFLIQWQSFRGGSISSLFIPFSYCSNLSLFFPIFLLSTYISLYSLSNHSFISNTGGFLFFCFLFWLMFPHHPYLVAFNFFFLLITVLQVELQVWWNLISTEMQKGFSREGWSCFCQDCRNSNGPGRSVMLMLQLQFVFYRVNKYCAFKLHSQARNKFWVFD